MFLLSVKYCKIPEWLRAGEFYRSLSPEDSEEIIEIPERCFAADEQWTGDQMNELDFCRFVRVALFWKLDALPVPILEVGAKYSVKYWQKWILSVPGAEESKLLAPLLVDSPIVQFTDIIATGKVELIVYTAKLLSDKFEPTAIAAHMGKLNVLKHLREQGFEWDKRTCLGASDRGHLECLQYAHTNGCAWDHECIGKAAQNGHLFCLQYLLEQGCPMHAQACGLASERGHLLCLQLLHRYHAPWDTLTTISAAWCSDTACLKFLHENGCPWDERTPMAAAQRGHLITLRYAIDHDCPYDMKLLVGAVMSGKMECLQYVLEEVEVSIHPGIFSLALLRGNLACLQYLVEKGCSYEHAKYNGQFAGFDMMFVPNNPEFVECVRYAVKLGWKPTAAFCKYVSTRDEACTEYLLCEDLFVFETEEEEKILSHSVFVEDWM